MSGSGEAASYGDLLTTSLVVLGAVCIAAFVAVRLFSRFLATGPRRGAHLLDVVARMPLEPRRSLYVVDVAGKTLLVGTSEMGLSVLSELDRAEVQSRVVPRPTFGELVRTAWLKRRGRRPDVGAERDLAIGAERDLAIGAELASAARDADSPTSSSASDARVGPSAKPASSEVASPPESDVEAPPSGASK